LLFTYITNCCFFYNVKCFLSSARAEAFKEEGNYEYKNKNFRKAIIAYTEGIMAKSDDKTVNAILYMNRATVNFTIGN